MAAAESLVGTPFHHQGRLPGVGLDCAGVIVCALRLAGVEPRDHIRYGRDPDPVTLMDCVRASGSQIPVDSAEGGDLLVFWRRRPQEPKHLGILAGRDLIHADERRGRVVREPFAGLWMRRIHSAWRLRAQRA